MPILEITNRCTLSCPICLVGDRPPHDLSLDELEGILDNLERFEGKLNMLNLSGGEPTLHPEFSKVVDAIKQRSSVGILSVSTDSLRLLEDDALLERLTDTGTVIALQLDGFSPETYQRLRGRADLADIKRRVVVDRLLEAGAKMSLRFTLARGINEQGLGDVLELLFAHDNILSMMVQPLAQMGPSAGPLDAITLPDAVRLLAEHSGGTLLADDFTPLPCSHPTCFALTYLLKNRDGSVVPLPRVVALDDYLDIIKNQALLGTDTLLAVRDSLYELWSSDGLVPNREAVLKTVKQILKDLNAISSNAPHREVLALGARHVKSNFIHHFVDRYTFDLSRAVKCCNHYPQVDGKLMPACVRNNGLSC